MDRVRVLIGKILPFMIAYLLVVSSIPYMGNKKVSKEFAEAFDKTDYIGSEKTKDIDRVALLESTYDAFDMQIKLIRKAKESLDIVSHTVGSGRTVDYFFGEVLKAADRGVKVRFLLEGIVGGMGRGHNRDIIYALSSHPNIECKEYLPLNLLKAWELHSLLHDKFIIVDNTFVLLGGRNIGDVYFNPPNHAGRVTEDRDVLVFNTKYIRDKNSELGKDRASVVYDVTDYMDMIWKSSTTSPMVSQTSSAKNVEIVWQKNLKR